jgi:acyl-CoA thioesterase
LIPEDITLEEARGFFANDRFATEALGAIITSAERGHAVCKMRIDGCHLNAMGNVMGGAIFTLADFALAIASNIGEEATVAISNSISFLSTPKGQELIAECHVDRSGRTVGFYTVEVTDELGTRVAKMAATCSRRPSR